MIGNRDPGHGDNVFDAAEHADLEGCPACVREQRCSRLLRTRTSAATGCTLPIPAVSCNRYAVSADRGWQTEAGQGSECPPECRHQAVDRWRRNQEQAVEWKL